MGRLWQLSDKGHGGGGSGWILGAISAVEPAGSAIRAVPRVAS